MRGGWALRNAVQKPAPTVPMINPSSTVLAAFLATGVQPLRTVPVRLRTPVTAALWALLATNTGLVGWLLAAHLGAAPCRGLACTVVTFGDRPLLMLLLSTCCVAGLVVAAPVTGGLTSTNPPQLAVIVAAMTCGTTAVAGLAAVVAVVALGVTAFVVVVDRL
jgi:hypothetical protein